MASVTMAASFLGVTGPAIRSPAPAQRRLIVTNAAAKTAQVATVSSAEKKQESNNGRRDLMFAAAAAAMCSVAGIALADEPKRGSLEAKKVYAPICVTMPTARVCHN
uniref:Photosystem II 5 kDa protein, chloroplastic n=1 Tax=Kalanchoe fedtschenkoi TaxID=63787 RepID=A0A7N0TKC9_KALFE